MEQKIDSKTEQKMDQNIEQDIEQGNRIQKEIKIEQNDRKQQKILSKISYNKN